MKNNYQKILLLTLFLIFVIFNSCKKEKEKTTPEYVDNSFGLVETPPALYDSIPDAPEIPPSGSLPNSYFLEIPSQIFDQGQQGSCASCATSMAKSILDHVKLGISYPNNSITYSPSYLFNQVHENPNDCNGSFLPSNFIIMKGQGVCEISEMSYDQQNCYKQPTLAQIKLAASHKIDHYFKLDPINIATIKEFINAGFPVIVSFKVDEKFYNNDNKDTWKSWGWSYKGMHAAILYGWDDSKNAFKLLNSWGNHWKDNGTGWVDYNFVQSGTSLIYGKIFTEAYILQNPGQSITKPIADFNIIGTNKIIKGQSVSFKDKSLNVPNSWSWTFPGGTPSSSNQQNPTITYSNPGNYDVSLTVSNQKGNDSKIEINYIQVDETIKVPIADFNTNGVQYLYTGEAIQFFDKSLNNPTSWSWSFPSGSPASSTSQNPFVTYNIAGTYNVTLNSVNMEGSDMISKSIKVIDKSGGGLTIQPSIGNFTGCDYPYSTRDLTDFNTWLHSDYITNIFKLKINSINVNDGIIEFTIQRCDNYNFKDYCTIQIYETNPVYFNSSYYFNPNDPDATFSFYTKFAGHDSKKYIAVITVSGGNYYCTKEINITW